MKKIIFLLILFSFSNIFGKTLLMQESFEGGYDSNTSNTFGNGLNDYFMVGDNSSMGLSSIYSEFDGSSFWVTEDSYIINN